MIQMVRASLLLPDPPGRTVADFLLFAVPSWVSKTGLCAFYVTECIGTFTRVASCLMKRLGLVKGPGSRPFIPTFGRLRSVRP